MDRPSASPTLRAAPILIGLLAVVLALFVSDGRTRTRRQPPPPAIAAGVRFRIVTAADGRPVEGARVRLLRARTSATSGSDGIARMEPPGADDVVLVDAAGFARFRGPVELAIVARGAPLRVALEPGLHVRCHVEDEAHRPIPGARVEARPDDDPDAPPIEVAVDASGDCYVDHLREGRWLIAASAPGHESSSRPMTLAASPDAPETFTLAVTAALTVRVVDAAGSPVEGADVDVGGVSLRPPRRVTTDHDGLARIEALPRGLYEARASRGAASSRRTTGIQLDPGRNTSILIRLGPAQAVGGRFVDAQGAPLEGVEVVVTEDALDMLPRTTTSGPDGTFILAAVPEAPHVLVARLEEYLPFGPVIVTPGESLPTITLLRSGTIRGRVVDANGDPVSGAVITLLGDHGEIRLGSASAAAPAPNLPLTTNEPSPALRAAGELGVTLGDIPPIPLAAITSTPAAAMLAPTAASTAIGSVTDRNGVFILLGVPPGTVQIAAHHPLHPTVTSAARRIASGQTIDDWNLIFPPAGSVVVRVLDAAARPLAGVALELRTDADDVPRTGISGYDGRFAFDGVVGVAIVTAMPNGRPAGRARAEVAAGARVELELRLEETLHALEGRVIDERNAPVEGARVEVTGTRARSPVATFAVSEADGTFRIDALPAPPYRVVVDHAAYATLRREDVRPPREGRLELRLVTGGSIQGRVADADEERPIDRAIVSLFDGDRLVDEDATDASGRFEFERVAPARYRLALRDRDHLPAERTVTLAPSRYEAPSLDVGTIEMIGAFAIRGRVTDALGDPVARARISLPFTLGAPVTLSDSNGEFELRGVAPGTHELLAEHVRAGAARARRAIRGEAHDAIDGVEIRLPGRTQIDEQTRDPEIVRGVAALIDVQGADVVVLWVAPGSAADAAGLRVGDRVRTIDGEPLYDRQRAELLLRGPTDVPAEIVVRRGSSDRALRVGREVYRPPPEELVRRR